MQVVLSLRVGGLERVVVDLVNHASDEFRFVVCCLEEAGPWASEITPNRGKVVALHKKSGVDWRLIWKIARLARAEKVDVIHTHNSTAHFYGAVAAKFTRARVLHTEHGKNIGHEARSRRLNWYADHFTDLTVSVSEDIAQQARDSKELQPSRLQVIPNGIRVDRFAAAPRGAGRRVGTVGRLVPEKNYPLLLRATAAIPDVDVVFVGDGPLREELQKQADARVSFLGQRADVAELLAGFDVFVLPSNTEGMSIALLEAMAAGRPIVVTAVGGNVELIKHMQTGLVVPPNDEAALRTAIERLLADTALATRLGTAARAAAEKHHSVKAMTDRYEELWRRLAV
ncbi:MAG: glycosyltransferase [Verrucomicrobiia bacterium]|jgi:glycosyltransferase involved in cell wall biosynthesis